MPQHDVNPYQSPSSAPADGPVLSTESPARWRALVFLSVILAVLIEVLPTQVDFQVMAARRHDVQSFLTVAAICFTAILAPVVLFVVINGWRGIRAVKWRIVLIGTIVALGLARDTCILVELLAHK